MTGNFYLDWAALAVSLFNTTLLLWLGLTVFLNAERRRLGIWLTSGGLMLGGAFFVSHSAILGHGLGVITQGTDFWWHIGWIPVAALPFAWYVVMLWYAGFWDNTHTCLHRRHRPGLLLTTLLALGSVALLLFSNPLPSFTQVAQLDLSAAFSIGGVPLLIVVYPLYMILCIGLSLDVLLRPGPSGRVMGDLARRRARPWLLLASAALLVVSVLVGWVMVWMVNNARQFTLYGLYTNMAWTIAWFDLIIESLIALAVVALGQAIVSYEIFTGKTLPRRGLWRYWRNAGVLAVGYSLVASWSLVFHMRPIYGVLMALLLIILFYALLSWRSYVERERYIASLRPFVASQRLYEQMLTASISTPLAIDAVNPFNVLCGEVLGASVAYLVALGPLAPLVGPPLTFPQSALQTLPALPASWPGAQLRSPETMCLPLEPQLRAQAGGATWAVPLWSERGLIGVLLLGDKRDGGLYTQEEIEIARASGERLIDTQASAEMARRLMALQRQRLAQSQVLDRRARRILHDEVLPRLHAAMLSFGGQARDPNAAEAIAQLTDVHRQISDLLRDMPTSSAPEVARLGLVGALRLAVDEELAGAFDQVSWTIEPEAERRARTIATLTAEVLFYAAREVVRNAACHARDTKGERPLHLDVSVSWRNNLCICVEDNGVGFMSETGGQGLALHSTMMAVIGGSLVVESEPGGYTRVVLALPLESKDRVI